MSEIFHLCILHLDFGFLQGGVININTTDSVCCMLCYGGVCKFVSHVLDWFM